ncbi:MAG: phage antirepressor KilAC domain-containing protein [Tannerella sp.]|jgi:anti-repressor protein|nr:phage antirepressor KilAC domain-containing protein [Tannerella sp.]
MEELVFKSEKGTPVTTSLLVAEKFGRLHKNVLQAIDNVIAQTPENQSRLNFAPSEYTDASGKSNRMYIMTKDGFSAVVLGFTGEQAIRFRWDFIEAFNKMEEIIRTGDYQIPKSYSEALMIAARQAEQIEQQQKQLSLQAPKVLFADAVATSDRSVLVSELAKVLKQNGADIGQNRLFVWLREHGYLCSKGEYYNQPTQKSMELGLFEIKKTSITKPDGTVLVTRTTKVTGKGQIYFVNKFLPEHAA